MRLPTMLLAATLMACTPPAPVAPLPPDEPTTPDPWPSLREGDLDRAAQAFRAWTQSPEERLLGTIGLLRIAMARQDDAEIAHLIAELPPDTPSAARLLVAAAAMDDAELDDRERAAIAGACDAPEPPSARAICAQIVLFRTRARLMRCTAACDATTRAPLQMAGPLPVVTLTLAGEPLPFVVDSGASISTLDPTLAARLGIEPIPGTDHPTASSGGVVQARYALATAHLGERAIADLRFALLPLPIQGLAGILSPQDAFPRHRVTLDLQHLELVVSPSLPTAPPDTLAFEPLYQARRPLLRVAVAGRPSRPLLLDSGADHTRLTRELEALGPPFTKGPKVGSRSVGGVTLLTSTEGELPAKAGDWSFLLRAPHLSTSAPAPPSGPTDIATFGILGLDALEGHALALDRPARRIDLTPTRRLPPWPTTPWRYESDDTPAVEERLLTQDAHQVELEATTAEGVTLRYHLHDDLEGRQTWLYTRPLLHPRRITPDGELPLTLSEALTLLGAPAPAIHLDRVLAVTKRADCLVTTRAATLDHLPARITTTHCDAGPPQTARLESAGRTWSYRRIPARPD
ncbi:MAG: pepsin/retropepsin-like aspartic protease family protein [Polyangiaceae bacterium]